MSSIFLEKCVKNKERIKIVKINILKLGAFHFMNSQMFSIGMFPYACLATMFIFCRPDSPRKVPLVRKLILPPPEESSEKSSKESSQPPPPSGRYYFFLLYCSIQLFLPYSHFITGGYNGWTQGAYGYSWDMMIHSFR